MSKQTNQKLKILYLAKILFENTDENHPMSISTIISMLEQYGINAERKSLYDDIEKLNVFGMDICRTSGKNCGYYNASSTFELAELKLLTAAVEASKFITPKKTVDLISKIESLTDCYGASELQKQIYVANRVKTKNEHIFYNVDKIHTAITSNRRISFRYFDYDIDKNKKYRKDGAEYIESPVALLWDDENYYLVACNDKYQKYVHYRVDRMDSITITDEKRIVFEETFDSADYARKMFSMFSGEEVLVTLRFENSLLNVAFDRFGMNVTAFKDGDSHFIIKTKIFVSQQFFGWVASLGGRATIISPENIRSDFLNMIDTVANNHKDL